MSWGNMQASLWLDWSSDSKNSCVSYVNMTSRICAGTRLCIVVCQNCCSFRVFDSVGHVWSGHGRLSRKYFPATSHSLMRCSLSPEGTCLFLVGTGVARNTVCVLFTWVFDSALHVVISSVSDTATSSMLTKQNAWICRLP